MDYYVTTTDGRIHHLEGITATPTMVTNDGVATSIFNGVYRDVFPFPNAGANSASNYPYGPGWTAVASFAAGTLDDYETVKDDVADHVAPRFLEEKRSYWKFVQSSFAFFFPVDQVVGMSNTEPTF